MLFKKHAAVLRPKTLAAGPGLPTGPRQNMAKRYPRQLCYRFLLEPLQTTKMRKTLRSAADSDASRPGIQFFSSETGGSRVSLHQEQKWLASCSAAWRLDRYNAWLSPRRAKHSFVSSSLVSNCFGSCSLSLFFISSFFLFLPFASRAGPRHTQPLNLVDSSLSTALLYV